VIGRIGFVTVREPSALRTTLTRTSPFLPARSAAQSDCNAEEKAKTRRRMMFELGGGSRRESGEEKAKLRVERKVIGRFVGRC